jgi:hypothetical protein
MRVGNANKAFTMNRRTRPSRCRRQGMAPIELLMGLPLLAALFVVLLVVASAALVAFGTVIEARKDAWNVLHHVERTVQTDRELDLSLSPGMVDKLKRIHLADQSLHVVAGGVRGQAQDRLQDRLKTDSSSLASSMTETLSPIERSHDLFTGTWDAATITFPDKSKDHPRLALDKRLKNFLPNKQPNEAELILNAFAEMIPK